VVPLRKKGQLLTIGLIDPLDINALDIIEKITNTEVEPVICTEKELNHLVGTLYGTYSDLGDALKSVEEMEIYEPIETETEPIAEEVMSASLQDQAEEAPVVRLVNSILSQAVREGASDVHFSPERDYVQLQFRVDGRLHGVPAPPKPMFLPMVSRLKILANMDIAIARIPQDGRFTIKMENKEINIRASTIPTIYGENLVLRLLDMSAGIYSLERLGMAEVDLEKVQSMITKPYGMILSNGPTGSGKKHQSLFHLKGNLSGGYQHHHPGRSCGIPDGKDKADPVEPKGRHDLCQRDEIHTPTRSGCHYGGRDPGCRNCYNCCSGGPDRPSSFKHRSYQ